jgi:uncharacterized membrane protein (DUF485 family)
MTNDPKLHTIAAARRRIAFRLTAMMVLIYFGFLGLIAWQKPLLGRLITPGLTLGIALGALVIVACWILTWIYVRWANTHYDPALDRIRRGE